MRVVWQVYTIVTTTCIRVILYNIVDSECSRGLIITCKRITIIRRLIDSYLVLMRTRSRWSIEMICGWANVPYMLPSMLKQWEPCRQTYPAWKDHNRYDDCAGHGVLGCMLGRWAADRPHSIMDFRILNILVITSVGARELEGDWKHRKAKTWEADQIVGVESRKYPRRRLTALNES